MDLADLLPFLAPVLLRVPDKLPLTSQELWHPPLPLDMTTLLKETKQFQEHFGILWAEMPLEKEDTAIALLIATPSNLRLSKNAHRIRENLLSH